MVRVAFTAIGAFPAVFACVGCSSSGAATDAAGDAEPADEPGDGAETAEDAGTEADRAEAVGEDGEIGADDVARDAAPDEGGPACTASTDPLTLWIEHPEIDLVGGLPTTRLGSIDAECRVDGYRVVAAGGMRVRFEANLEAGSMLDARLALYDAGALSGRSPSMLAEAVGAPGFTAILEAAIPAGGEYLLVVHDLGLHDAGAYALAASCLWGCDGKATRFPIVLLHGFGGWESILSFLEYFYGVADDLEDRGYDVHVPVADASNDSEVRSRQFAEQIDAILAGTKARKVNFVAHSQGGLDGRMIISTLGYGDRVGALVMVATPNQGTLVADAIVGDMPVAAAVLSGLFDLWSGILGWDEADTRAAFEQLTTRRIREEFNPANPDDPRVLYRSYAGRTCAAVDLGCRAANSGEVVDPLLRVSFGILDGDGPDQGPNDGLVVVGSATYGSFLGTVPADHWDEIGQLADSGPGGPLDHLAFYREIAAGLHDAGL